jgi:tetratricopeptide (TPR) repeat protein
MCINLASRLQEKARAGEVLVGPSCRQLCDGVAEFEPVGPFELKGIGSVPAWRLDRLLEVHATLRPPFVGRALELATLGQAFDRSRSGIPTFVLIVGPPGQGKSRLVGEFVDSVRGKAQLFIARCRPDDEKALENPFRQLLELRGASPTTEDLRKRLDLLISDPTERGRVLRALAHSSGLELSPELLAVRVSTRESEFLHGWSEYLDALSHERPVVAHLEDLQWAEPGFTRVMSRLAEKGSAPLLIVATSRPETLGAVALRPSPNLVQIDLGPLDPEAAEALARNVGTFDPASVERSQGNPLFLLELARASDHPGPLPLTIQAAIGAHLDALATDDRVLLSFAAVVGEEFLAREVAILADRPPAEVTASLARLAHLRYIAAADGGFRFHHRLVRDVAYLSLTTEDRLRLHARFAQDVAPVNEVETAAQHWWVALGSRESEWVWRDDPERAEFRHSAFEAQVASAQRHLEMGGADRALEVAGRASQLAVGVEEAGRADWLTASIHAARGEGNQAWEAWQRILDEYAKANQAPPLKVYQRMVRQACWIWGTFRRLPRAEEVVALMDEGIRLARANNDALAVANLLVCRRGFVGSAPGLPEALEAASTTTDLSALGEVLVAFATVQSLEGDLEGSLETWNRIDSLIHRGAAVDLHEMYLWRFMALFQAGELAEARRVANRAHELSRYESPHYRTHTHGMLAWVAAAQGDWVEVKQHAAETEKLVTDNPSLGFCLVGAGCVGWGSVCRVREGGTLPNDLEALVARMVPESKPIQASVLFLPSAMTGSDRFLREANGAYQASTQFWNRQEWDQFGVNLDIGLTVLERWNDLEPYLDKLAAVGHRGGHLCAALRSAILEERASAGGGPQPRHEELRRLGYTGLSDLLSFRPNPPK